MYLLSIKLKFESMEAIKKQYKKFRKYKTGGLYHYSRKNALMTNAERRFFELLVEMAGDKFFVFPQVHLTALLEHKIQNGQWWDAAFIHINGKSVDYVICDGLSLCPLVAIELDDWSHELEHRKKRDIEVERIMKEAKIPLVRFVGSKGISKTEIISKISLAVREVR